MLYSKERYILILLLLTSCTTKTEKEGSKTGESLINEVAHQEEEIFEDLEGIRILDDKVHTQLPIDFELMSEEMLEAKYPSNKRPTLVYTNDNGSVNFVFNHTSDNIPRNRLSEILPAFVNQFNSIYPEIEWFTKEFKVINGKTFIVLEFITPVADLEEIYNLMYVTVLEGRMLICSFNCIKYQKEEWEAKAKVILNSIEIRS